MWYIDIHVSKTPIHINLFFKGDSFNLKKKKRQKVVGLFVFFKARFHFVALVILELIM